MACYNSSRWDPRQHCAAVLQPPLTLVLVSGRRGFPAGRAPGSRQELGWGRQELCSAGDQPPWSHAQHPKHEPLALAAAAERAAHAAHGDGNRPTEPAAPGAHRHSTLLPGSARSMTGGLILVQLRAEHTVQGINASSAAEPSRRLWCPAAHPPQPEPQGGGSQAGEPRQSQSHRRMGPGRAVCPEVHESFLHREPKSQRSCEGESTHPGPRLGARPARPPERHPPKRGAKRSLQLPGPLRVPAPRPGTAALPTAPGPRAAAPAVCLICCLAHRERYD